MSEELEDKLEETKEDDTANTEIDAKELEPLEVKVINKEEKEKTPYDETEDVMYENMYPTDEQIKEYEDE